MKKISKFVLLITFFCFAFLAINFGLTKSIIIKTIGYYLFYITTLLFVINVFTIFIESKYKIKNNFLDIFFIFLLLTVIIFYEFLKPVIKFDFKSIIIIIITMRNFLSLYKSVGYEKKFDYFSKKVLVHPAKTIISSYLFLILTGTTLLMLPISSADNQGIGFINSFFTITSAVCVTGLTVVDTATKFSLFGQIVILLMIQIGGLGIMIFSYFAAFIIGRKISFEEKLTISFMLNDNDMKNIYKNIKSMIIITFLIEVIGALFLLTKFSSSFGLSPKALFFSIFHSISAFCNAGFALFTDSLISYKSSLILNFTICVLIILGGLSFSVILNIFDNIKNFALNKILKKRQIFTNLNLNTIIVLIVTSFLILSGILIIYGFEHDNILLKEDLKTQYLAAIFQSITLRTAGFNTIDISSLHNYTYIIMILFMFIGGASGSTAGGIKVNTVGVIFAYFKSVLNNQEKITLFKKSISKDIITRAFLIVTLSGIYVFISALVLSISEKFSMIQILFEVGSAFGTVGLSTGITPFLSNFGKVIIIMLMFIGKIGPLTILLAVSRKVENSPVEYPEANITIG
ncbi:MAG: hypothetical protein A2Y34_03315 [Spirochaetes bacterium GWC1_27_15]|nr:MAG: hypothetical protein A2Z98_01235 [Spirochaetes bacterium GWB1_27_13]OHD20118.1 MAG: hypothetical protein A2Y34_03315 [Spirochaetes bacterium GWC1_27_15]